METTQPSQDPVQLSRAFAKLGAGKLSDFAVGVFNGMSGNAAFATPPVAMTALQAAQLLFTKTSGAVKNGGHAATEAKTAAHDDLILKLRALALYIEELPGITAAIAATSNFKLLTAHTNTPVVPAMPVITGLFNFASTKLGVTATCASSFKHLQIRVSVDGKTWVLAWSGTSLRNIVVPDLLPGTLYIVQCRAGNGGQLFSEWSDPVSHMST
jgi:hypothetical protein